MKNIEPFLFRFKSCCVSPTRVPADETCEYDTDLQMMMTTERGKRIPAIASKTYRGRTTKKADLEKGDDQKDDLMWR